MWQWGEGGQLTHCVFGGLRGGGGKGGGSSAPPPPPPTYIDPVDGTVYMSPEQLNQHVIQRKAQEQAASAQAGQQSEAQKAQAAADFATRKQGAYDTAMQQARRAFELQGVDPSQYMASDIEPALRKQMQSIQEGDPNPSAAFQSNLGDTIVGNVLTGKRQQATNALNSIFTPTYANNLLPDTLTGQYASDIVNEQFNPLSQQLINAQRRNTLTPAGYQAAVDAMNQKKQSALATVQNLGSNILSADRSALNDIVSGAKSEASNLGLASAFDPSAYAGRAQQRAQQDISGFGGALRSAVGETKFADINDLINAGGAVQGSQNPNAANPTGGALGPQNLSPGFVPDEELARRKRGLGSTGAF